MLRFKKFVFSVKVPAPSDSDSDGASDDQQPGPGRARAEPEQLPVPGRAGGESGCDRADLNLNLRLCATRCPGLRGPPSPNPDDVLSSGLTRSRGRSAVEPQF